MSQSNYADSLKKTLYDIIFWLDHARTSSPAPPDTHHPLTSDLPPYTK